MVAVLSRARVVAVLVLARLLAAHAAHADEPDAKLSLAVESDDEAWQHSGFRLGLGLEYGELSGLRGAPSGRLLGPELHVGMRLDRTWSLYTTFEYASASSRAGISGLRFAGTIDPTWHLSRSFSLGVGFGFGGIVEGHTNRPDIAPLGSTLDTSYTFPSSSPPLPSCSGDGVAAIARATYTHLLGPHSATTVELEMIGQDTTCSEGTGNVEPDTAQPIVRRQYWTNVGATLFWGMAWR